MRTGGIIRILVGLIVAVLLTALLVLTLSGVNVFQRFGYGEWNRWRNAGVSGASDTASIGTGETVSIAAGDVREIGIDWMAGGVELRVGEGEEIVFYETANADLTDEMRMRYSLTNGKLNIQYWYNAERAWNWLNFGGNNWPTKRLTITVPASLMERLSELEIDTVSADIDIDGAYGRQTSLESVSGNIEAKNLAGNELEFSTTSGTLKAENCVARSLEVGSVSGSATIEGAFESVELESVSGSVKLQCLSTPVRLESDSVSGDVTIQLPADSGFTARLDTVSGRLTCELPGTMSDKRIVCGDGSAQYRINSVSGSVRIQQLP